MVVSDIVATDCEFCITKLQICKNLTLSPLKLNFINS